MSREARTKTAKVTRSIAALMHKRKFNPSHLLSVIQFLQKFEAACDSNDISEGVSVHQLQYFLSDNAAAPYEKRLCSIDDESQLPTEFSCIRKRCSTY